MSAVLAPQVAQVERVAGGQLDAAASPIAPPPLAIARPAERGALRRIEVAANHAVAMLAYRARRVGILGIAGAALLAAALALLLFRNLPQVAAVAELQSDLAAPTVQPALGVRPGGDSVASPLATLPRREDAPAVIDRVLQEARAAGVELPRGQYEFLPARDGIAARYSMTFPIHASYPQLRQFMDRTLLALPAVAVEGLRIERKDVGADSVDAELKLSLFVRS